MFGWNRMLKNKCNAQVEVKVQREQCEGPPTQLMSSL